LREGENSLMIRTKLLPGESIEMLVAIVGCCGLRAESSGGSNKSAKTRDSVNDGIRQRTEINIMRMNRIDRGL